MSHGASFRKPWTNTWRGQPIKNDSVAPSRRERELFVKRCIAAWCDTENMTRTQWEKQYPADIRQEALHEMSIEQLRSRS